MLTSNSGVSSKRFCGVLGFLAAILVLIFCTLSGIQAPLMIDTFLVCIVGLLGVDSVTSIWKSR